MKLQKLKNKTLNLPNQTPSFRQLRKKAQKKALEVVQFTEHWPTGLELLSSTLGGASLAMFSNKVATLLFTHEGFRHTLASITLHLLQTHLLFRPQHSKCLLENRTVR